MKKKDYLAIYKNNFVIMAKISSENFSNIDKLTSVENYPI